MARRWMEMGRGVASAGQQTAFFGKTYDEAMSLLVEARNYLAYLEPVDRAALVPMERLKLCCETMRLTARLTQIMAWLLAQRAVHEGELTRGEALADPRALADVDVCMEEVDLAGSSLPPRLVTLLERSRHLYVRVARLDGMARQQIG